MSNEIVIFGSGGHAKVVIDIIEKENKYKIVGVFTRDDFDDGATFCGYPLHKDSTLKDSSHKKGIIAIGTNSVRKSCSEHILSEVSDFEFVSAIHPASNIGNNVSIGKGTVVMAGATINPDTTIGDFCIINTCCSVDHDGNIKNFGSVAPGARLGGNSTVGEEAFVGIGAIMIHGRSVGDHSVIGAGSVVISDIPEKVVAVGNPCKEVKKRNPGDKYL